MQVSDSAWDYLSHEGNQPQASKKPLFTKEKYYDGVVEERKSFGA